MAEFEQLLASNSGEDPFETAVRLLAAKLFDELRHAPNQRRFKDYGDSAKTLAAIEGLYVQAQRNWPWLNGSSSEIGISASSLAKCIRPLIGWGLLDSDLSVLDATLERLVSRDAKGQLGQYFTPREIVRLCVEVLNPSHNDSIIDPASGSGAFLFESVQHCLKVHGRAPQSLGIDLSARSVKVGALLSESHPHLNIKITKGNSLDARDHRTSWPAEWEGFIAKGSSALERRDVWRALKCSCLLTNPPFAGEIDEIEVLRDYASVNKSTARPRASREHLFLERAVRLLNPGGRLAIVVPQAVLANASSFGLRSWLYSECRLLGVIGLHPFAFLPYTSVKTSLLFLQRRLPGEKPDARKPVFFAVSSKPGKDSSGRATGSHDYSELADAFGSFLKSEGILWAKATSSNRVGAGEIVPGDEVEAAKRFDAEHFGPASRRILERLSNVENVDTLHSFVDPKIKRFKRSDFSQICYVDISSVDAKTGIATPQEMSATDAPGRASYVLEPGDVLVSTVRPERNVVGLIERSGGPPKIGSNGFCVLRPKGIAPEVIFAHCKTDIFRTLLSRHSAASMYPTVADKDVLSIPFHPPSPELQREIIRRVREGMKKIADGNAHIAESISLISPPDVDSGHKPTASEHRSSRSYSAKKRIRRAKD